MQYRERRGKELPDDPHRDQNVFIHTICPHTLETYAEMADHPCNFIHELSYHHADDSANTRITGDEKLLALPQPTKHPVTPTYPSVSVAEEAIGGSIYRIRSRGERYLSRYHFL